MKQLFPQGLKGIIYDCDGVMIDSADANRHLYNLILGELGLSPITPEQAAYAFQATFEDAMKFLVPVEKQHRIEEAINKAVKYDTDVLPKIRLMPGYREFIETAHNRGMKQAIDTNRTDIGIEKVIVKFNLPHYFDPVVTSTIASAPKPSPAGVEMIQKKWRCEAGQMLFVGDSPDDAKAAKSGGAVFASFGNANLGGDLCVSGWKELEELLWQKGSDGGAI